MTKNEIKKALYKIKPAALFNKIENGFVYYEAILDPGTTIERDVNFKIPVEELGETTFDVTMESQLLIRWLDEDNNT